MSRHGGLALACVALFTLSVSSSLSARTPQAAAAPAVAADAAKASPELVGELAKEIGGTPEQAAGAAGALFGIAKKRLKPEEFSKVEGAVPGMGSLLKAAPGDADDAKGADAMTKSPVAKMAGLAGAASAFTKLGLKPSMVAKAVPVLTKFVGKSGGADVGKLLAGALK